MLTLIILSCASAFPAHALLKPQALATDARIKTIPYSPNEIYKFTGHYGYQSVIEFGGDEEIMTISIGDSMSWQLKPAGSRLFIKPVEQDAQTNMTVITTKHTYHFELHGEETASISDDELVFVLRFLYLDISQPLMSGSVMQESEPDLTDPEVREKLNFNYSIIGPEVISPIRIFDDGEFTFFEFEDINADVPAFFLVDPLGNESLINFRTMGNYIVVERVAARFTLRSGAYVLCVFNESRQIGTLPEPEETSIWNKIF